MKDISKAIVYLGVFAIPFIPLIIANSMFFPFITGKNFTFRIIVEVILAAWIILALYEPQYRPKFSWILGGFAGLLVVMFLANILGEYPLKSFWSNFERMEGYVTLVHVFAWILVAGSVINTDKLWNRLFNATLFSAVILSFYAFAQLSGEITINQGGWRLDGTLGNSAYMAIYMLFHVFIAALMFVRSKTKGLKYLYATLLALFVFLLIQTATRGTILGMTGGALVAVTYMALFAREYPVMRKIATSLLVGLVVFVALFITFKDSAVIQGYPQLARVANITLSEADARFEIWGMALDGVKERPILGWGQGNYNYVFNKYYKPELYSQEQWFDRVHNIVMDWLIAGGVLGFIAYFFVFISAIYYLFVEPFLKKGDESFTVAERGILIGLLAGYLFHNMFVFDNIVSFIFYGMILAFIHSKVARSVPNIKDSRVSERVIANVAIPVVAVSLIAVVYFVNIPNILAAKDIINAFQTNDPIVMMAEFDKALSRGSFGNQEIREQMTRQAQSIIQSPQVSPETKQAVFEQTEAELLKQIKEKPGDARVHVFISSFYRFTKNYEQATEQLAIARSLSPNKQQIIFEQALVEMQKQQFGPALSFFKEAYELDTNFGRARTFYAAASLYAGKPEVADELLVLEQDMKAFALDDFAVNAVFNSKNYDLLQKVFAIRVENNPNDPQMRVSLAVAYYDAGDIEKAVEILRKAGEDIPTFKEQANGFISDLEAGRLPGQADVTVGGESVESRTNSI